MSIDFEHFEGSPKCENRSWSSLVAEFMRLNGHAAPRQPSADLPAEIVALRQHLMMEELGELTRALNEKDLIHAADAITDLLYVVVGTGVALGLGPLLDPLFREVHSSNMTKDLGPDHGDGASRRAIKGSRYRPPDIEGLVKACVEICKDLDRKQK